MTAAQEAAAAHQQLVDALTDRLGLDVALQWVDDFEAKVTRAVHDEHEADLERARDRSHRLGVQAVVDGIRGRLMQTAGVPSRTSLLAHLAALERTDGTRG